MIASVINAALVLLGSAVGLLFKSKIKESWSKAIMVALGLCVLPYLLPDIAKLILADLVARRVKKLLAGRRA